MKSYGRGGSIGLATRRSGGLDLPPLVGSRETAWHLLDAYLDAHRVPAPVQKVTWSDMEEGRDGSSGPYHVIPSSA
jgi:hypothetical protein